MANLDLTDVYSRVNDIKRELFYGDDVVLRFMRGSTVLLELSESFFIQKDPTSAMDAKSISGNKGFTEFFECSIADLDDDIDLEAIIKLSPNVEITNGADLNEKFVATIATRPRGLTKKWSLRLTSEGKK